MIPTFDQMQRGRGFTRTIGSTVIELQKRQQVYIVRVNGKSTGHMTYDAAVEHLVRELVLNRRLDNDGGKRQGDSLRRLQRYGNTQRRGQ